jgi:hypothetical protein
MKVQCDVRLALAALISATLFVGCSGGSGSPLSPSGPSVSNAFQHSGPAARAVRPDIGIGPEFGARSNSGFPPKRATKEIGT